MAKRGTRKPNTKKRNETIKQQSLESIDISQYKDVNFVEVDGSVLEGGGQILRNAVAYSCLLCKPIHISKIRMGRNTPGLRPQHLTGIQLIVDVCNGTLLGGVVGSTEIYFIPKSNVGGKFVGDTHTAGSVCLMIQTALPCILFAHKESQLTLIGGTDAEMAPPIGYVQQILKPILCQFGVQFQCDVIKRGFYPKGGGKVVIAVKPITHIRPIRLMERGKLQEVTLEGYATEGIPPHVLPRLLSTAGNLLKRHIREDVKLIEVVTKIGKEAAVANGCGLNCLATTSGGCMLGANGIGRLGVKAEVVGEETAEMLARAVNGGGCVDEHLQDQLIIFMTLADGVSMVTCSSPLTLHTQTAIHIAELLTGVKFKMEDKNGCIVLSCEGISLRGPPL